MTLLTVCESSQQELTHVGESLFVNDMNIHSISNWLIFKEKYLLLVFVKSYFCCYKCKNFLRFLHI